MRELGGFAGLTLLNQPNFKPARQSSSTGFLVFFVNFLAVSVNKIHCESSMSPA